MWFYYISLGHFICFVMGWLLQVLEYGNAVRSKGATGVNPDSSRSHAVLQMEIRDRQDKRLGRLVVYF